MNEAPGDCEVSSGPPIYGNVEVEGMRKCSGEEVYRLEAVRSDSSSYSPQLIGESRDQLATLARLESTTVDYRSKCIDLLKFITSSEMAADLKLSFYMVACEYPTFFKPFPIHLVPEDEFGLSVLGFVNEEIPSVKLLKIYLQNPKLKPSIVNLLHWLFLYNQEVRLKPLPSESVYSIYPNVKNGMNFVTPSHIFKFMSSKFSNEECKWQASKANKCSLLVFYKPTLCMMHSLLNVGFQPVMLKEGGIRLWSDLEQCLRSAEDDGWCWGKSALGSRLRTVLLCELLEEAVQMDTSASPKALTSADGEDSGYFVTRPDQLRIRYVLLFVDSKTQLYAPIIAKGKNKASKKFGENKRILYLFGAILIAGAVYSVCVRKKIIYPDVLLPTNSSIPRKISGTI